MDPDHVRPPPMDLRAASRLSDRVLARGVAALGHYVLEDGARVNPNLWKPVGAPRDAFQLYRERKSPVTPGAPTLPGLLVSGKVRGRVESALWAAESDSQEQLALLNTFLFGEDVVEGNVVAAVQQYAASAGAPAAQTEFCGGKALVKQVQTPKGALVAKLEFLEHRGYTQSPVGGELVGFFVLVPVSERVKSGGTTLSSSRLDLGVLHELAHVESLCCLFRQVHDDVVDVFLLANAYLSRGLSGSSGAPLLSTDSLFNMANLLECAETKRLTVMKREAQQSVRTRRFDSAKPSECSMCRQKKRFFGGANAFTACEACGNYVCGRCRVDKRVFVPRLSRGGCGGGVLDKISACKPCSMAASSGPSTAVDHPTLVLSECMHTNRAGSRDGGPSTSNSSLDSCARSRASCGCSSSSGSTTSAIGKWLVYYEGDFASVSSTGLRPPSSSKSRSVDASVPSSTAHHLDVGRTPPSSARQRRHESFEGAMPSQSSRLPPQRRSPVVNRHDELVKERARSGDWVASCPDTSLTMEQSKPRDRRQHERFPASTRTRQATPSYSRQERTDARPTLRQEYGSPQPTAPAYAVVEHRKRAATNPAPRAADAPDLMQRMMELNKLAERSYGTAQRNGAMIAHHLRDH